MILKSLRLYLPLLWILIAISILFVYQILPYESVLIEKYYSKGLYSVYRQFWDLCLGWSPVPLIYVLLALLLFWAIRKCWIYRQGTIKAKVAGIIRNIVLLICIGISLFYLLWGFNYKRQNPLNLLLDTSLEMNEDELFIEYQRITDSLQALSTKFHGYNQPEINMTNVQNTLLNVFKHLAIPYQGKVNARKIYPKGVLLRLSTAGIYIPFVGEGHIDAGLHPITWPFTQIHEMSHGYGFTGEDICNFWALMACINSDDLVFKYSGYFSYWRYLRGNASLANRNRFDTECRWIPLEFADDYKEIIEYQNRYPDILPKLRDLIYDNYLKSHGIQDGLKNYSRIIILAHQWKRQYGSLNLTD